MTVRDLASFRDSGEVPTAKEVAPLDIRPGLRVLAFDPAIAKTAWALVSAEEEGLYIAGTGMLTTPPDDGGQVANLVRATAIWEQVNGLLAAIGPDAIDYVAHERPPVGGGRLARTDSAAMASVAIHIAVAHLNQTRFQASRNLAYDPMLITTVASQTAKARLCGKASASKAEVKAAVADLVALAPGMAFNQDISDAIAVGLVAMEQLTAAPPVD